MYVIQKLRLNKFQSQPVTSARALFARMKGKLVETTGSKQTSDCISDAGLVNVNKLQELALADAIIQKQNEFAKDPDDTDPLSLDVREL